MSLLNWAKGVIGIPSTPTIDRDENTVQRKDPVVLPQLKKNRKQASGPPTDYVLEAKRLFLSMGMSFTNLGSSKRKDIDKNDIIVDDDDDETDKSNIYRNLNILYKNPSTGGIIFTGNDRAASNLNILTKNRITSVVNCTRPAVAGTLPNYHINTGRIRYYDFPIACWNAYVLEDDFGEKCKGQGQRYDQLTKFLKPMLQFIEKTINRGENVLIHCLAGAHRAGTTSIICLMHFNDLKAGKATKLAKSIRPVIDPISDFPRLLDLFEQYRRNVNTGHINERILSGNALGRSISAQPMNPNSKEAAEVLYKQAKDLNNAVTSTNRLVESLKQGEKGYSSRPSSKSMKRRRSKSGGESLDKLDAKSAERLEMQAQHNAQIRSNMRRRGSASDILMATSGTNINNKKILNSINEINNERNTSTLMRTKSEAIASTIVSNEISSNKLETLNTVNKPTKERSRINRYSHDGVVSLPRRNSKSALVSSINLSKLSHMPDISIPYTYTSDIQSFTS